MIFNIKKIIALIFIVLAWILFTFFFVGCANTSYHTIPSGMREDAQDYNTKYNMMDSQDGSKNPNAQVRIFGVTYWQFFNLQYIEYMSKTKTITFTEDQFNIIVRGVELLKGYSGKFSKNIDEVLNVLDTIPYNEGR